MTRASKNGTTSPTEFAWREDALGKLGRSLARPYTRTWVMLTHFMRQCANGDSQHAS